MPSTAPKRNILIADDEKEIRLTLGTHFTNAGYTVTTASDGEEAVTILQSKSFDAVILDINMPKLTGFDVLRFIRKNFPAMKVVMLTGYGDLRNAIESRRLGADDFISKPFGSEELMETLERLLGS